ncbi:39S ribosomal protein L48, mitochondrial [Schistocerca cancellata]|uniref:39S ribosomal protein L48, mitochondrial n=1 Tax=Schistocerca cancellata TaxID=274614 RepID=UPI002118CE08|nr:39S ribosomal protein L48, mitochondrial [Schistocerca cancellata]XP_049763102.1 39S ribosomal protein L48, mitochondrial [Schistocerca cancellata]XP_049763103.1 39S ribosomal protein L48, mitochondrial [Schistocerca cancellata]XP_049763105.1 39S ribosomal protein L48, mitochondrial [Schistocerca cancellata]
MLRLLQRSVSRSSHLNDCLQKFSLAQNQRGRARNYSIYEPDYLDALKPKIPVYDAINIQIKGYDYPVLEHYQKFIHNLSENMNIEVEDGWALPAQTQTVQRFKPQSTVVDSEYKLSIYERNVQIVDVPSTTLAILLNILRATVPEGVNLSVHEHSPEHEEIRYVPDQELLELKSQLEALGGPRKK